MTEMQIYSYETATIRPRTKLYESVQRISTCSQIERTKGKQKNNEIQEQIVAGNTTHRSV